MKSHKPAMRIRPAARAAVENHAAFIARRQPGAAVRFVDAFLEAVERIADNPGAGSPITTSHPRLEGVRKWPIRGLAVFLVFYLSDQDGIEIIRVLHGARDWPSVLSSSDG